MPPFSATFEFHPWIIIYILLTDVHQPYGTIYSYIWNGSNAWSCTLEGDRILEREWVHYLVSWNKIDCRAYKNGKLVDVGKSFSSKGTIHGTRLNIGRYGFGKMWLDDLKVWERPLGEEEAYQVYRSGE